MSWARRQSFNSEYAASVLADISVAVVSAGLEETADGPEVDFNRNYW